jgi:thioredoxin-like negative regulator of GroEL
MNPEVFVFSLLIRLAWALGIVAFGISAYLITNKAILAHARSQTTSLETLHPGAPVLLYFTTPTCAPCKTIQRPAIKKLEEQVGGKLQVIEIDASARPELASRWGVLSVPTTFVIDAQGKPRHVNHGVASADKLLKQINEVYS